jgi:hypothetical protein
MRAAESAGLEHDNHFKIGEKEEKKQVVDDDVFGLFYRLFIL